jgi:hypothetical protein
VSTDVDPNTLLCLLQRHYGRQWSIRRNGGLWVATATSDQVGHAPTLIHEDVETFVHQLENPPPGVGRSELLRGHPNESGSRADATASGPVEG